MTSTASLRTLSPTSEDSTPRFEVFKMKKNQHKHSGAPKYRKKNGDLWAPPKGWLPFYRCQACHELMSKKEASKTPQRIFACGHITCAKCIVTSYLVELNPLCPVEGCDMCVNPRQKAAVAPVEILTGNPTAEKPSTPPAEKPTTPPKEEEDEDDGTCWGCRLSLYKCKCFEMENSCSYCGHYGRCACYEWQEGQEDYTHYCGDRDCVGDCGVLSCGCIDTCRNRCGLRGW